MPALQALADLCFPTRCVGCGLRPQSCRYLCHDCHRRVLPFAAELRLAVPVDFPVRPLTVLEGPARELVHALKYEGRTGIAALVSAPLAALSREAVTARRVVPIPLHWRRRWRRGYDQAALLARGLARERPALTVCGALRRRRATAPQVGLSAGERRDNLRAAFAGRCPSIAGQHCILVDDVVTTGATLRAAAAALNVAGARAVLAVTVAVSPQSVGAGQPRRCSRASVSDRVERAGSANQDSTKAVSSSARLDS
jgi:ComF family protein